MQTVLTTMQKIKYMLNKARDVKVRDILSFFPMVAAKIISPIFLDKYKKCWLICEEPSEARDNGYFFFKYMCEHHPERKCIYAISPDSVDYKKVEALGKVVAFGSIMHWLLYFTCEYNISSQKGGKPNAALCAFLELNHISKVKNVFLQHGVTINNARWLYSDRSSFFYFITATKDETDYIGLHFGYKKGVVQYTGFPRFDNLHNYQVKRNRILIMPSWRVWFKEKTAQVSKQDSVFVSSDYLNKWRNLLSCDEMREMISQYSLEVIFYPHRNMQSHISHFQTIDSGVIVATAERYDIQQLLKSSELIITDYSSVFFDMAYMKKPIIFYQFDEEKFRCQQYQEGYFDYHNNPFGQSYSNHKDVLKELRRLIENHYIISGSYLKEHSRVFSLYDDHNSERIYNLLD